MGTLLPTVGDNISKNIPDGYYKDLAVPPNSSNYTTRAPALGNNIWYKNQYPILHITCILYICLQINCLCF